MILECGALWRAVPRKMNVRRRVSRRRRIPVALRTNVKERLGERIRRKRAELKLGLRETAAKVGISPTYLSRIETMAEKTPPAEDVIRKLATLLNDNFDELMQLAGRVPEDVEKVIKSDPTMSAFLRTAKQHKLSGDDLMKILAEKQKGKKMTAASDRPTAVGRPPRAESASTSILQVRCTPEERAEWMAAARRRGMPLGQVVRDYLARWAKRGS